MNTTCKYIIAITINICFAEENQNIINSEANKPATFCF